MKRPEGFDRPKDGERATTRDTAPRGHKPPRAKAGSSSAASTSAASGRAYERADGAGAQGPELDDLAARGRLRRASRNRRRYEHSEVRRFTRRSRRRRITWAVAIAIVATMLALVAIAVYSPLLALKKIEIDGASRVDPASIRSAVDGQLETPLALIDFERITDELSAFPLIRSYVTEVIPPDTLRIHVVEREAIGSIVAGSGFTLIDPAGVVIERSATRPPGWPLIDVSGADSRSAAFDAAVEVMLALPDSVRGGLDTVTASTRDDVRLTLAGGGAEIIWGSASDSDYKARVLAAALAQNYPNVTEYNVSAPGQLTYR